jgi:hypothetical protein
LDHDYDKTKPTSELDVGSINWDFFWVESIYEYIAIDLFKTSDFLRLRNDSNLNVCENYLEELHLKIWKGTCGSHERQFKSEWYADGMHSDLTLMKWYNTKLSFFKYDCLVS